VDTSGRQSAERSENQHVVEAKGCILVVDDEKTVRDLLQHILEINGYDTLVAEDGKHAIEIYSARGEDIKLTLLDLTMPNISGQEAYQKILELDKDAKVILMSGYSEMEANRQVHAMSEFISKPFDQATILAAIARQLENA